MNFLFSPLKKVIFTVLKSKIEEICRILLSEMEKSQNEIINLENLFGENSKTFFSDRFDHLESSKVKWIRERKFCLEKKVLCLLDFLDIFDSPLKNSLRKTFENFSKFVDRLEEKIFTNWSRDSKEISFNKIFRENCSEKNFFEFRFDEKIFSTLREIFFWRRFEFQIDFPIGQVDKDRRTILELREKTEEIRRIWKKFVLTEKRKIFLSSFLSVRFLRSTIKKRKFSNTKSEAFRERKFPPMIRKTSESF